MKFNVLGGVISWPQSIALAALHAVGLPCMLGSLVGWTLVVEFRGTGTLDLIWAEATNSDVLRTHKARHGAGLILASSSTNVEPLLILLF